MNVNPEALVLLVLSTRNRGSDMSSVSLAIVTLSYIKSKLTCDTRVPAPPRSGRARRRRSHAPADVGHAQTQVRGGRAVEDDLAHPARGVVAPAQMGLDLLVLVVDQVAVVLEVQLEWDRG